MGQRRRHRLREYRFGAGLSRRLSNPRMLSAFWGEKKTALPKETKASRHSSAARLSQNPDIVVAVCLLSRKSCLRGFAAAWPPILVCGAAWEMIAPSFASPADMKR